MGRKYNIFIALILLVSLLALATPLSAEKHHVFAGGDIQSAIDSAFPGDTVYVHAGTYDVPSQIRITKKILLIGDGESSTFLDGGTVYTGDTISEKGIRLIYTNGLDNSSVIKGFTIQNGFSEYVSDPPMTRGGGMYNENSSPTVTDCTFSGNSAGHGGGMCNENSSPVVANCTFIGNDAGIGCGMYNENSSPTVTGCTFSGNTSICNGDGGAIANHYSSPEVTDCTFSGNSTGISGGIYNNNSSPTVTGCTFSGNNASYGGGIRNDNSSPVVTDCTFTENDGGTGCGMYNDYSSPVVTDCTFSGNSSIYYGNGGGMANHYSSPIVTNCLFLGNTAMEGGGIYNEESSPTFTDCTFSGNSGESWGGGMLNSRSITTITNCTFSGNISPKGGGMGNFTSSSTVTGCTFSGNIAETGGGMRNCWSSLTITNCTFLSNRADYYGGGMDNDYSSPIVTNCTFSKNSADHNGGGMWNVDSCPTLTNCILWNDTASTGAEIHNETGSNPSVTYSDIQGGYAGVGNIDANPLFVDATSGDFHLFRESPCIDAGRDASATLYGSVTYDIKGTPRPQKSAYDMGAYEFVFPSWSPMSLQPLVATSLAQANELWQSLGNGMAACSDENVLKMAGQVQEHMAHAATMANPVAACGGLRQAMCLMGEIAEKL